MLEIGVDEITLVFQLSRNRKSVLGVRDWDSVAEELLEEFVKRAGFLSVFGDKEKEEKAPEGYKIAYKYGSHPFYFFFAYNPYYPDMGIIVKFSAQALDYYVEATGLEVYRFMQKVIYPDYTIRLSRIDLTADYIDEDINITRIYQNLMDGRISVFREYTSKKTGKLEYKKVSMGYSGFLKEQDVPTIYIGSVQSDSRLRIYDKKCEQIENKGTKFDKAVRCKNWVRFEGVFKHEYAHQISEQLFNISSDDEYLNLIALVLVQKFCFMTIDKKTGKADVNTDYTQMLLDAINNKSFKLKAPSTRNYSLMCNIDYIFKGSGIMNTLYKVEEIWGVEAAAYLLEYMAEYLTDEFEPSNDCLLWLRKNKIDYQKKYPTFNLYIGQNFIG